MNYIKLAYIIGDPYPCIWKIFKPFWVDLEEKYGMTLLQTIGGQFGIYIRTEGRRPSGGIVLQPAIIIVRDYMHEVFDLRAGIHVI